MLSLLDRCFHDRLKSDEWQNKLKAMIPSYGKSLAQDEQLLNEVRAWTTEVLGLNSTFHTENI
jgi:malate dehydrogenase (quinone)